MDDIEEQKCTPVRASRKKPSETNNVKKDSSKDEDEKQISENEEADGKKKKKKNKELETTKSLTKQSSRDEIEDVKIVKSREMTTQDVEEAEKLGIETNEPPNIQASGTNFEMKSEAKTLEDDVETKADTPSKPAEKKKKKKQKVKTAEVKDENNAIGQICNEDISWEEKKKKKEPKKVVEGQKKEGTARRGARKIKKKEMSEDGEMVPNIARTPTKVKKIDGGSTRTKKVEISNRMKRNRVGSITPLTSQDSKDNLGKEILDLVNIEKKKRHKAKTESKLNLAENANTKKKKEKQEGFFRSMYNKAKTTITARLNKSDDTFVPNPEVNMKINDVRPEYGCPEDYGKPPDKPVQNFDNNGNLFVNGRPFWCVRDEKPPSTKICVVGNAMRDLTEGKWTMVPEIAECYHRKDLDPFHTMEYMQGRDAEYFKKDKRVLSNTIRSLASLHEGRGKRRKEKEMNSDENDVETKDGAKTPKEKEKESKMVFVKPKTLVQYNRKNRFDPTHSINFTPGITKKVKASQRRRANPNALTPEKAQPPQPQ